MDWLVFASLNILFLSLYGYFTKSLSQKIDTPLRFLAIGVCVFLVSLIWFLYSSKTGGKLMLDRANLAPLVMVGLFSALAIVFFQLTFTHGAPLSIGVLVCRVGVIIVSAVLGIIILKEPFTPRILVGFLFSILGLYLLIA
jgi:uncharacterized membrane protein